MGFLLAPAAAEVGGRGRAVATGNQWGRENGGGGRAGVEATARFHHPTAGRRLLLLLQLLLPAAGQASPRCLAAGPHQCSEQKHATMKATTARKE